MYNKKSISLGRGHILICLMVCLLGLVQALSMGVQLCFPCPQAFPVCCVEVHFVENQLRVLNLTQCLLCLPALSSRCLPAVED